MELGVFCVCENEKHSFLIEEGKDLYGHALAQENYLLKGGLIPRSHSSDVLSENFVIFALMSNTLLLLEFRLRLILVWNFQAGITYLYSF